MMPVRHMLTLGKAARRCGLDWQVQRRSNRGFRVVKTTNGLRLLVVCFLARAESVRIFSARRATKREREDYEENVQS